MNKMDVILRCKDYNNDVRERFENNIAHLPVDNVISKHHFLWDWLQ